MTNDAFPISMAWLCSLRMCLHPWWYIPHPVLGDDPHPLKWDVFKTLSIWPEKMYTSSEISMTEVLSIFALTFSTFCNIRGLISQHAAFWNFQEKENITYTPNSRGNLLSFASFLYHVSLFMSVLSKHSFRE